MSANRVQLEKVDVESMFLSFFPLVPRKISKSGFFSGWGGGDVVFPSNFTLISFTW